MKSVAKKVVRTVVQSLVMLPIGVLTSEAGYHLNNWEAWAILLTCSVLLVVSNKSFHNELMEKQ